MVLSIKFEYSMTLACTCRQRFVNKHKNANKKISTQNEKQLFAGPFLNSGCSVFLFMFIFFLLFPLHSFFYYFATMLLQVL